MSTELLPQHNGEQIGVGFQFHLMTECLCCKLVLASLYCYPLLSSCRAIYANTLALDLVDGLCKTANVLTSDSSYRNAAIFRSIYGMLLKC